MKNIFKIYLALVSFISIITIVITFAILATNVGEFFIISDKEYIVSRHDNNNCESEDVYNEKPNAGVKKYNTKEKIDKCNDDAKNYEIQKRHLNFKSNIIGSVAWLFSFAILFIFHYPKFHRITKNSKEIN